MFFGPFSDPRAFPPKASVKFRIVESPAGRFTVQRRGWFRWIADLTTCDYSGVRFPVDFSSAKEARAAWERAQPQSETFKIVEEWSSE